MKPKLRKWMKSEHHVVRNETENNVWLSHNNNMFSESSVMASYCFKYFMCITSINPHIMLSCIMFDWATLFPEGSSLCFVDFWPIHPSKLISNITSFSNLPN